MVRRINIIQIDNYEIYEIGFFFKLSNILLQVLDHLRIEVEKVKEGFEPNKKQAVELAIQKEVNNLKR